MSDKHLSEFRQELMEARLFLRYFEQKQSSSYRGTYSRVVEVLKQEVCDLEDLIAESNK